MDSQRKTAREKAIGMGAAAAVFLITLAVFYRVLSGDFVMWDDDIIILNNRHIAENGFWWAFTDIDSMMRYNPLTFVGWSFTHRLAGFAPYWFHFGNWLLHGASAALLYLCLEEMVTVASRSYAFAVASPAVEMASAFGALFWSLHPLRVEPVAWATDRTYCQAIFFLLGALLCYLKANGSSAGKYRIRLGLSVSLYIASLLSYALGITFLAVLVAIDIFLLQRVTFPLTPALPREGGGGVEGGRSTNKAALLEKLWFLVPALAVSLATLLIRYSSNPIWDRPVPLSRFGLFERSMQAFYIWWHYLWKTLYPARLAPIYTELISFDPLSLAFIGSLLMVLCLTLLCLFWFRRRPYLLGLWICYLLLHLPFLGLFEHPHFAVDRYSLLPALCLSVPLAVVGARLASRWKLWQAGAVMALLLLPLAPLSYAQSRVWHDSGTLFKQTIETLGHDPYRVQMMGRLASYYRQKGETEKAVEELKELLAVKPESVKGNAELAEIYRSRGDYRNALPHYLTALSLHPSAELYYGAAAALKALHREDEAERELRLAESMKSGAAGGKGMPGLEER